jgi:predicted secreted protein
MTNAIKLLATSNGASAGVILVMIIAAIAVAIQLFGIGLTGAIALYFVVWWIMLFAVLPFGVRSQLEDGDVVSGSEPGAPSAPLMVEKAIWTTIVAGFVFLLAVALMPLVGL